MRYYILHNKNASIFSCSSTGLVVTTHKVEEAVGVTKMSSKIKAAVEAGGLREVSPEDIEDAKNKARSKAEEDNKRNTVDSKKDSGKKGSSKKDSKEEDLKKDTLDKPLESLSDDELVVYYKENFEVTSSDIKSFKELTREEKLTFLKD